MPPTLVSKVVMPSSIPARQLARAVPLVSCRCSAMREASMPPSRKSATMRRVCSGLPTPMVSPSEISSQPMARNFWVISSARRGSTSPWYGQPQTVLR